MNAVIPPPIALRSSRCRPPPTARGSRAIVGRCGDLPPYLRCHCPDSWTLTWKLRSRPSRSIYSRPAGSSTARASNALDVSRRSRRTSHRAASAPSCQQHTEDPAGTFPATLAAETARQSDGEALQSRLQREQRRRPVTTPRNAQMPPTPPGAPSSPTATASRWMTGISTLTGRPISLTPPPGRDRASDASWSPPGSWFRLRRRGVLESCPCPRSRDTVAGGHDRQTAP